MLLWDFLFHAPALVRTLTLTRAAKVLYSNSALVALALASTTSALDSAEANPEAHSSAYADSYALVSGKLAVGKKCPSLNFYEIEYPF
jgi:hypothetical protein